MRLSRMYDESTGGIRLRVFGMYDSFRAHG